MAGKAALAALLERDPLAKVLVVDARTDARKFEASPNNYVAESARWGLKKASAPGAGVEFAEGARVSALNADLGYVTLSLPPLDAPATAGGTSGEARRRVGDEGVAVSPTRHGPLGESSAALAPAPPPLRRNEVVAFGRCLLALGSRPKPPPPGFIDPGARGRVTLLGARGGGMSREELRREMAAGRAVTIVGSSWQALELACWLRQEGRSVASSSAADSKVIDRLRQTSMNGSTLV